MKENYGILKFPVSTVADSTIPDFTFNEAEKVFHVNASDFVVEFLKKDKSICYSEIGQMTGLDSVTTCVKWYPDGNSIPVGLE